MSTPFANTKTIDNTTSDNMVAVITRERYDSVYTNSGRVSYQMVGKS